MTGDQMSDSLSAIREYLLERSNGVVDAENLDASDNLLEDGVLDSLGLMELIMFLGSRFAIELRPDEIDPPDHFKSLKTIAALVDSKVADAR
jgi:acyl carrier protein